MKKIIALAALLVCALFVLVGCGHRHTSNVKYSCTEGQVCSECGEVMREPTEHLSQSEATCTQDSICYVCGTVMEEKKGHVMPDKYNCMENVLCAVCGEVMAQAPGHTSAGEATCTKDEVCSVCGEVLTVANGHVPGPEATATTNQKCVDCGEILAYATGSGSTQQKPVEMIPETFSGGHYNNNINAYYSGSVLVCGDYALEYFSLNSAGSSNYASIVNNFAAKYPQLNVTNLLVPKSATFNAPSGYSSQTTNHQSFITNTYAQMNGSVVKADAFGIMAEHKGEYLFYRTDHHWTSLGAYYASVAYCQANGITPLALSSYRTVVNTGFIGTLYSFCNSPKPSCLLANPDYTVGHLPQTSYTLSTYPYTAIVQSAKSYAGMFLGGDQGFMHFVTENKNGKKLIIFKESYGNAFAPYMLDYYEEVIVIDIRYTTDSVESIINEYGITDALIINNVQAAVSLQTSLSNKLMS
ncbi:MAG: hypothetical protein IKU25_01080 [Clostridia bacterium]|nr:hypothetical protein [Clostridia bacterium]